MNYDKPIQMDTSVKVYETPQIEITAEQFKEAYIKGFQETAKTVYAIGKKFGQIDSELAENKEYIRVSEELEQLKADYIKEWENPENINLDNEKWKEARDIALQDLRMSEFEIIRNSKLKNSSKESFAKNSNESYRERGVKYTLQYGEFTRKRNLDTALMGIDNYVGFLGVTDNESDRQHIIGKINNYREILKKYGVDMTMADLSIVNKIDASIKTVMKQQVDSLFSDYPIEQARAMANEIVVNQSQKFANIISNIGDVSQNANAYKFMEDFYKANKSEMNNYIKNKEIHTKEKAARGKAAYESEIADAINLGNPEKLVGLTLKGDFGTTGFLSNKDGVLEKITNTNTENFYDIGKPEVFPVLTNGYINKISGDRAELKKNGYTGRAAMQPLYDMTENLTAEYEDQEEKRDKKMMIYKHYGLKTGLNPYALYKGESDPDYIEATEGIEAGKNYISKNKYVIDSDVVGSRAMGNLDVIAYNFSQTNNVLGRDRAVKFVLGVLYNSDLTRKNIEADTDIALKEALNDKETYNRLFELSKKASEFEGKKIYRPAKLRDPRKEKLLYLKPEKKEEGQTEQQKKENEKKIIENSKGW